MSTSLLTSVEEAHRGASKADGAAVDPPAKTYFGPGGGALDYKPETLTHLWGRHLVHKDHPRIILRGKLDSLAAQIITAQVTGRQFDQRRYVADLGEVLDFVRHLLRCEYTGEELGEFKLAGFDAEALRECSHNPVKFFGHRHMLIDHRMGPLCAALNCLRALARETELAAVTAFKKADGSFSRDDLAMALNRLSSLLYILMFKHMPDGFDPEPSGI